MPGTWIGTIVNDDPLPKLSIDSVSAQRGRLGHDDVHVFTVSPGRQRPDRFYGGLGRRGAGTALIADGDYQNAGGTLTSAPLGATSRTLTVRSVAGDLRERNRRDVPGEPREPVSRNGKAIDVATGTGSIVNDDPLPKLSVDSSFTP